MPGHKCVYLHCSNRSGGRKSLFVFPKDSSRSEIWAKAAGREDLLQKNIRTYKICEDHFEIKWMSLSSSGMKRLYNGAVPSIFCGPKRSSNCATEEPPAKTFGTSECRACLKILAEDNMISLEREVVAEITILEALKKLTDIQVPETDLLPQKICEKCFSNLQTAINFSTQVLSSDEKLKSRLRTLADPLLIKPEPCDIKTEEFTILDNNVIKPLEDNETITFKMEVVEENIEKFESSETTDISNANAIEMGIDPEKECILDDCLKNKHVYESTMSTEPPEELLKKLPPKVVVPPEYTLYHNVFKTPRISDNSCLCPECKIFQMRWNCQEDIKRMHESMTRTSDNAALCPKCGKIFNTRYRCQVRIKNFHTGLIQKPTITNYLCPDCGQVISGNKKKLLAHMTTYHSNKTRRSKTTHSSCLCTECGKMFKTNRICTVYFRNIHYKNMAIPRKRDSVCPDCGRSISGSKQKFLSHWVLHHSNKVS